MATGAPLTGPAPAAGAALTIAPAALTRRDPSAGRYLSPVERLHAAVGWSGKTLETPRHVEILVEGAAASEDDASRATFDLDAWREALTRAAAANPGASFRLGAGLAGARWVPGMAPALRHVASAAWDGRAPEGGNAVLGPRLSLRDPGPTTELVLADGPRRWVLLRTLHALMDGAGAIHFLADVFRARRGEAVVGSNGTMPETDVMRRFRVPPPPWKRERWAKPTSAARDPEPGDTWRRITLEKAPDRLLPRIALAVARIARERTVAPARFMVPADLRKHVPGLRTTTNMTGLVFLDVDGDACAAGEAALDPLVAQYKAQLERGSQLFFHPAAHVVRIVPLGLLDQLNGRTARTLTTKAEWLPTGVLSNLGRFSAADLTTPDFAGQSLFAVPIPNNFFCIVSSVGPRVDLTVGMPRAFAEGGRLKELASRLEAELSRA